MVGDRSVEVVVDVGVREDLERMRSGSDEAREEVGGWFDRLVAGTTSPAESEEGCRQPAERMDRLERELARLRADPGDLSVADLDVLIEAVERSAEASRRLELLSQRLLGPTGDPVTCAVVEGALPEAVHYALSQRDQIGHVVAGVSGPAGGLEVLE